MQDSANMSPAPQYLYETNNDYKISSYKYCLLTATMGGCFQNNCSDDDVDKSQMDKVAKMLEEFKQLYADLMMVELGHL